MSVPLAIFVAFLSIFIVFLTVPSAIAAGNKGRSKKYPPQTDRRYTIAFSITLALVVMIMKSCDVYCESHHEQWDKENKEYWDNLMQESYNNCKFEHDY